MDLSDRVYDDVTYDSTNTSENSSHNVEKFVNSLTCSSCSVTFTSSNMNVLSIDDLKNWWCDSCFSRVCHTELPLNDCDKCVFTYHQCQPQFFGS